MSHNLWLIYFATVWLRHQYWIYREKVRKTMYKVNVQKIYWWRHIWKNDVIGHFWCQIRDLWPSFSIFWDILEFLKKMGMTSYLSDDVIDHFRHHIRNLWPRFSTKNSVSYSLAPIRQRVLYPVSYTHLTLPTKA